MIILFSLPNLARSGRTLATSKRPKLGLSHFRPSVLLAYNKICDPHPADGVDVFTVSVCACQEQYCRRTFDTVAIETAPLPKTIAVCRIINNVWVAVVQTPARMWFRAVKFPHTYLDQFMLNCTHGSHGLSWTNKGLSGCLVTCPITSCEGSFNVVNFNPIQAQQRKKIHYLDARNWLSRVNQFN